METNQPKIAGYEVIGRLGAGGMGIVWEAVQFSTRRRVALKLLSEASLGSERRKNRFVREVELAASLEHPNIARVYDSGLDKGVYYYAMELVKGPSLDEFVSLRKLKPKQMMILMRRVCQAMAYAHERGVVHRDLKPSNILVDKNGQPHVLDFGLAKMLDSDDSMALSLDGDVTGTPMYMSPEQAAGDVGKIDARTDVYALGIIAYRLLTGSTPHDMSGTYLQVIRRVAEEEVRRPILAGVKTDAEMEAILLKALSRDPAQRYANAGELGEDIGRYLEGEPILARPAGLMHTATRHLSKHRWPAMAAGLAVALVGMTVALFVSLTRKQAAPVSPGDLAVVPPPIVQRATVATQAVVATTPIAETQTAEPSVTPTAAAVGVLPPAPINLNASPGDGKIQLTWDVVPNAEHISYSIFFTESSGPPYKHMGSTSDTTFEATGMVNGTKYFFVVQASNTTGSSPNSVEVSAIPQAPLPPAPSAPEGITATPGDGQVTVTWTQVQSATSYTISYNAATEHDMRDVKDLQGTSYTISGLTNGIDYYFIVKAVNSGGFTAHMPVAMATPQAPQVDLKRGLVLHFSCDKRDTGGVIKDESGNGNDGRLTGARWVPAGRGGAYQFVAARKTDAIMVSDSRSVDVQYVTLTAWIRTTQHDRNPHRIFDKDWRSGFALTLRGGNIAADQGKLEMDIGLQSVVSDISVANGAWHLVAGTYDGSLQKLYIDGKEQGTILPWGGIIERHVFPIQVGNGNDKLNTGDSGRIFAFDGEISDLRMYDRALSKEEIGKLFADAPLSALAPNPRAVPPAQPAQLPPPVTAAGKKPGEIVTNSIGMKLAYIPAGVFLMGSPETEEGRSDDQRQHQVTLTKPFYLGVTLVTVGQFTAFAKTTNYQTDAEKEGFADQVSGGFRKVDGASWRNPGYIQVDDDPVVDLSWNDATAFCDWLQSKDGGKYRLPSEAEWEYSCRAGTRSMYFWGDEVSLVRNYAYGQSGVDHAPRAAQKKPNPWGLYDMVGIVWQWCDDRYAEYPDGAAIDPHGPTDGNRRVLRGGGWYNNPGVFHSAGRFDRTQAERRDCWSFRVVREIPNP